jgi:outer membrane protein OmpA-like peptidoglycan-associated protein
MNLRFLCAVTLAAVLAGCAITPRPPLVPPPVAAPTAPSVSLAAEQRRLSELFRGTPVVFEMLPNGSMRVEVPLKYSFDKGRTSVKPPLAAVLDRIAPSVRSPGMRARVAPPTDASGASVVALERAASTRDYLVAKGVPVSHFTSPASPRADSIEIVIGRL